MDEEKAKQYCRQVGSELLSYTPGRVAHLRFASGEWCMLSIAPNTAALLVKPLLGWQLGGRLAVRLPLLGCVPGLVLRAKRGYAMVSWVENWSLVGERLRLQWSEMVLDGLLFVICGCRSVREATMALDSVAHEPQHLALAAYARIGVGVKFRPGSIEIDGNAA